MVYSGLKNFLDQLLKETLSLAVKTEMLPPKFSGNNYSENKAVIDLLKQSQKVNKLIDGNPKFWHILLDGKTKGELAIYKRVARDISFSNKNWTLIQKTRNISGH